MINNIRKIYWLEKNGLLNGLNISFSQFSEDIIIRKIFDQYKIKYPTYLDIGTNHPVFLNNTYHFYINGSTGVLIEPDISLIKNINRIRPKDTILNIAINSSNQLHDTFLYIMDDDALNTMSTEEAELYELKGYKILGKQSVKVVELNQIASDYYKKDLNFVSLDVEGNEYAIIESIDFKHIRPNVFCIETWSYSKNRKEEKIIQFMLFVGYHVFADTTLNTIFVDNHLIITEN